MGLNQVVLLAEQVNTKSMGERISKALSDSVMSMIIVFVVLFLICIIISSFRLLSKYDAKMKESKEVKAGSSSTNTVMESISQNETKELVDDLELVAVITAAIYAYEEACGNTVPTNGLYVRSIKKMNSKWRNA